MNFRDVIVVGTSAGGLEALRSLVKGLPSDLAASVLVVLHTAPQGPGVLPAILQRESSLPVAHAVDREPLQRGRIYVAPPDHHLLIDGGEVRVTRGPKENLCRPSVDALFRSAASAAGPRAIGVILTGRLDDGTAGLWAIKEQGGTAVVQDPEEALYPSMPRSALQYVSVDHVISLAELAPLLVRLTREPVPESEGSMSQELEVESKIAREGNALSLGVMDLGPVSPYTCPECHGVLVQLKQGGLPRFRCHTGHAFSLSSLLAEVTTSVEDSLWNVLRTVEESMLIMQHIARHIREQEGNLSNAEHFEQKARDAADRVGLIRQAILRHEVLSQEERIPAVP
jgi:two-component system chemotaxis response regulator CheB